MYTFAIKKKQVLRCLDVPGMPGQGEKISKSKKIKNREISAGS
jgi:hypothetical protein